MLAPIRSKESYIHIDTMGGSFYLLPDALEE